MAGPSMTGQWIEIKAADGGKFRGYLATPASGKGPGIVLCQEIFGINAYVREVADYYAEEGYVVLAPDLFWRLEKDVDLGYSEEEWKKAFDFFQRFDIDKGMDDITAAVQDAARPAGSGRQSRRARLLSRRQARVSRGGALRRGCARSVTTA